MNNRQSFEIELKRLKIEFDRLRHLYHEGKISEREYVTELKKLRVKDSQGRFWTIGAQSGQWYYFDGRNWIRSDPPIEERTSEEEIETYKPSFLEQPLAERFQGEENELNLLTKSFPLSPEIDRLDSDLTNENQKSERENWVFMSLPFGSSSLFFGGMGILLGILAGAVAGSTRFFLNSFQFLPLFLQEIMGKPTGGIIFAALGGLVGFIFGCGLGFFISLIFNLTASITGGLMIKLAPKIKKEKSKGKK